jgi:hypothetical protein
MGGRSLLGKISELASSPPSIGYFAPFVGPF